MFTILTCVMNATPVFATEHGLFFVFVLASRCRWKVQFCYAFNETHCVFLISETIKYDENSAYWKKCWAIISEFDKPGLNELLDAQWCVDSHGGADERVSSNFLQTTLAILLNTHNGVCYGKYICFNTCVKRNERNFVYITSYDANISRVGKFLLATSAKRIYWLGCHTGSTILTY